MRGLLEGQLDFGDATEREGGLNAQARRAQLFEGLAVQRSHARGEPFEAALYGFEGKLAEDRDDNLTAEVADVGRDGEPGGPLGGGRSEPASGEHVVLAAHRDHLGNGGGFAFGTNVAAFISGARAAAEEADPGAGQEHEDARRIIGRNAPNGYQAAAVKFDFRLRCSRGDLRGGHTSILRAAWPLSSVHMAPPEGPVGPQSQRKGVAVGPIGDEGGPKRPSRRQRHALHDGHELLRGNTVNEFASTSFLVPLDGSSAAEHALPWARALAAAYASRLVLMHVVDDREAGRDAAVKARDVFVGYAAEVAAREQIPLGEGSIETGFGPAAPAVLAASEQAGLVVLASHGRGGFQAAFLGSVADKIVRGARVPTLVVPGTGPVRGPGEGPIVVPLDGSPEGERALAVARDVAEKLGREIVLLRAYSVPPPAGAEFAYYPADWATQLEEAAAAYLAEVAKSTEKPFVVHGPAAQAVVDLAESMDASLVVMASGGKGLARRIALGSTTDRVLHSLHRPLLILPPAHE